MTTGHEDCTEMRARWERERERREQAERAQLRLIQDYERVWRQLNRAVNQREGWAAIAILLALGLLFALWGWLSA